MRTIFLALTFAGSGIAPAILTRWLGPIPAAAVPIPAAAAAVPAADEARPRVIWELTTFQAAEPDPIILEPVDSPLALDAPAPAVVRPSPQMPTPQAPAPQAFAPPVTYAAPPIGGDRVVSVTYGEPFIVSDSRQFAASYPQMPMTYAAPAPALTYPQMPTSYGAPGPTYGDGAMPTGQAGVADSRQPGAASIYIDAHSTLEHGPRFGIGNGLFRSGRTERVGNSRGGGRGLFGGLFGRRGGQQGATYSAPMVCGPGGCY